MRRAFTAGGELPQLENALHEGLGAGLTVNEIKEILVQMYAYAGSPRSLNAITTFMAVLKDRQSRGNSDEAGTQASPPPADRGSVEIGTENLDVQSREIATIAALANLDGVNSQLESHFAIGFNTGLTEAHMKGLIAVLRTRVGQQEAENASDILTTVLTSKHD